MIERINGIILLFKKEDKNTGNWKFEEWPALVKVNKYKYTR